jgi:hypothetical protein
MQRELWRPATMAKPNWHGRNEVKANRRSEEEEEEEEEGNFKFWILNFELGRG